MVGIRDPIDVQEKYVTQSFVVTAGATTVAQQMTLGNVWLDVLDIFWAPGHVGLVGVRVQYQATPILPWNQPTGLLFGSNERRLFTMGIQITHHIGITVVNLDAKFGHTVQVTAATRNFGSAPVPTPTPLIPLDDLA